MSQQRFSHESKNEAVRQVTAEGHSAEEVVTRLDVSTCCLYP